MKLSRKDILLVFGIIVAIVVTLTTMAYREQNAYLPGLDPPAKKTSVVQAAGEMLKTSLHRVFQPLAKQ